MRNGNSTPPAFTLIELLVVVAIIALLISILLPSLGRARQQSLATRCLANLSSIGKGLVVYQTDNDNFVVPSYNMTGNGSSPQTVDGWCAILDRDGDCLGYNGPTSNVFYCPNTLDLQGMAGGQTGTDLNKPKGWQDYPTSFLGSGDSGGQADPPPPPPPPRPPYLHEIRCSYWINAYNPTGSTAAVPLPCPYYTQSVGYVGSNAILTQVKAAIFVRPSALIVAADGVYTGRQSVSRLGETNSRIGYRHPGKANTTISNAVFADGHAEPVDSSAFPHGNYPKTAASQAENNGSYSLYSDQ